MHRQKWLLPLLQLAFLCCVCPLFANAAAGKNIEETEGYRVIVFFLFFIAVSIFIEVLDHQIVFCLTKKLLV